MSPPRNPALEAAMKAEEAIEEAVFYGSLAGLGLGLNVDSYGSSKPRKPRHQEGGEPDMTFEDETERAELALDDHAQAREYIQDAVDRVVDAGEDAGEVAEGLYDVVDELEGSAARAVGIMADYLMQDRSEMDDRAVELQDTAADLEDTVTHVLNEAGVTDPDAVYDALSPSDEHEDRLDRMRDKVDNVYFD